MTASVTKISKLNQHALKLLLGYDVRSILSFLH